MQDSSLTMQDSSPSKQESQRPKGTQAKRVIVPTNISTQAINNIPKKSSKNIERYDFVGIAG